MREHKTDGSMQEELPPRVAELRLATDRETALGYAELTADLNPLHLDADFAAKTPFGKPILHGTIALSLLTQAIDATFGEREIELDVRFVRPVPVGTLLVTGGEPLPGRPGEYEVHVGSPDGLRFVEGTMHLA